MYERTRRESEKDRKRIQREREKRMCQLPWKAGVSHNFPRVKPYERAGLVVDERRRRLRRDEAANLSSCSARNPD